MRSGDFSRASHLSVKTLRHYHDVGLLEPTEVNAHNGYRYSSEDQIATAQVISRLRGRQMPVAEVKAVLDSSDRATLIQQGRGAATVFVPVAANARAVGRVEPMTVPAAELAVIRYEGSRGDVDLS